MKGDASMGTAAPYRHWTDGELELLADTSLTSADVAAATGRSEAAVKMMRSRRGVCAAAWTPGQIERLRDYTASPKQIAAETGHALSSVYAKRAQMGLPSPAALRAAAREAAAATAEWAVSEGITLRP